MIKIKLAARGGVPPAVWASAIALALWVVLAALFKLPAWAWLLLIPVFLAFFIIFMWSASRLGLTVSRTEIRVQRTGWFRTTRRLARRNITGTTVLATPLQRAMGVCVLVLHTAGLTVPVVGIRRQDAALIVQALEQELLP